MAPLAAILLLSGPPATATTGVPLGRFGGWSLMTNPPMVPPPGQPSPPMRYLAQSHSRDRAIHWDLEFEGDRVDLTVIGRQGCSRTEHRSTAGLDDPRLAREVEAILSLQTARLQLAGCIARPSTAVIELRRMRNGLRAMLRALRAFRRNTSDPMA